ncbi:MAG: anti-sigma factor [Pseudomonadota bacterium]
MNLQRHPELLDQLAASYALGTLRAGARRRFETLARENPAVRARALLWQENLSGLTELLPEHMPSPNVWKRIENQLSAERSAVAAAASAAAAAVAPAVATRPAFVPPELLQQLRRALVVWRGAALAGGLATVAAVLVGVLLDHRVLQGHEALAEARAQSQQQLAQARQQGEQVVARLSAQLQASPNIQYVAVLADDKAAASILVTFDPVHQSLTLKRVNSFQEAPDRSLELWALPPGAAPQSLGVMGAGAVARLTAAEGQVAPAPTLAITLEPKGGAPAGIPTGPILFKGPLLKTTL